jgi:hypothetical protein
MTILKNSLRTPDGTEIVSNHRHDYVTHVDKNGKTYMVDGGRDYLRRSAHGDEVDTSEFWTPDTPHSKLRELLHWGTRGRDGKQPLVFRALKDLDDDHIEVIIDTQSVSHLYSGAFHMELAMREFHKHEIHA